MRHTGGSPTAGGIVIIDARIRLVQEVAANGIHTGTIDPLLTGVMTDDVLRASVFGMAQDPS